MPAQAGIQSSCLTWTSVGGCGDWMLACAGMTTVRSQRVIPIDVAAEASCYLPV
jgi:hypothetical protein